MRDVDDKTMMLLRKLQRESWKFRTTRGLPFMDCDPDAVESACMLGLADCKRSGARLAYDSVSLTRRGRRFLGEIVPFTYMERLQLFLQRLRSPRAYKGVRHPVR